MALTDKQKRFVEEYLCDLNATQAAIRAGYSERTANREGHRLLSKADIQAAIQDAMRARSERTELTADWVLMRLREEASERRDGSSHAARVRALELLGKHLDIFEDRFRMIPSESNEPTPYERRLAEFRKRYAAASDSENAGGNYGADVGAQPAHSPPAQ